MFGKSVWKKVFFLLIAEVFVARGFFAQDSEAGNSETEKTVVQTKEEAAAATLLEEEKKTDEKTEEKTEEAGEGSETKEKGKKKSKKKKKEEKDEEEKKDTKTVITIMNALKSGNRKDEKNGDELLTFDGNVKISVEKNGSKTIISADKVSYNRARDMLFAEGAVKLEQTESSGATQSISSDSLLFNTETLEGVFDNSRVVKAESNAINLPSGSKITVASDLFARDDSGTISFKDGSLTFCDEEESPHWRIKASRIWLLPGNEFAFLNALVYVGPVPVMYLPAFYYPKDELIFNPVFGYRNRAGYFFQTSTYIFGRKPLDTGSSSSSKDDENNILNDYFSLIKPTKLMDQKREGLILHNLDTEYKGDTSNYLKIILDYYTNLGVATGLAGSYKGGENIPSIDASAVLGFSNTVFQDSSSAYWHSFAASGITYKDESNFMGVWFPFRYKANLKVSGSFPLSYSLSLPIYSDPFFNYDFGDRNETMDWFSYLLNNPNQDPSTKTEDEKRDAAEVSSFTWENNLSYSFTVPEIFKPFVSSLSINSFDSTITFGTKNIDKTDSTVYTSQELADNYGEYNPNKKFFYPTTVSPLNTGVTVSGTIFSTSTKKNAKVKKSEGALAMELGSPEFSLAEKDGEDESPETKTDGEKEKDEGSKDEEKNSLIDGKILPDLSYTLPSVSSMTPFSYSLTYSFSPSFSSQITYASEPLKKAADFDFNKLKTSFIQVRTPLSLNSNLGFYDNFFGITNNITFEPFYQQHPYIADLETVDGVENGGYSESSKKSLIETDYKASYMKLHSTNSVAFMPLVYYRHFKETKISWNTTINWLRTQFIGDADNPEWDYLTVDWNDKESITSHTLSATMAANEFGERFKQSLTFTATLPPQVDKYYGTLNLVFPYLTTTAETGMSKKSATDDTWKKEQFRHSATLSLFNSKLKLTESYNYEWEEWHHDSFKVALSFGGLQASYTMRYTTPYDFDEKKGWVAQSEKEFLPYSLALAYSSSNKKFKKWKNRIEVTPGLSTSISYDFIRPTQSYFIFSPSVTFRLHKFFYVKFSMESRNDVIYRYFQDAAGASGRIPGETNPFIDLINGFRFDDEELRKSSGFKLKSFVLEITHDLHDWDFNMKFKISPRLVTPTGGQKYYDFSPYFSLSVVWRPMDSIKTKIADKYGDFVLNGSNKDE